MFDPLAVQSPPDALGVSGARLSRVDDLLKKYVDEGRYPFASLLMLRRGVPVHYFDYGFRDCEAGLPIAPDTILRIYSMTKPITAVAALMLYEQGRFQLDDPIGRYLPAFADIHVIRPGASSVAEREPAERPVTFHDLFTHTSGFTYGFSGPGPVAEQYRRDELDFGPRSGGLEATVERLSRVPLAFHPGRRWNYGVSTDVLGRLVEVLAGVPLDDYLRAEIFEPLGMTDTSFGLPADKTDRFAALYDATPEGGMTRVEGPDDSAFLDPVETFSGGGGLLSTIGDFARFAEMLRRKGELDGTRLLGRKTAAFMVSNQLPGDLAAMGQPVYNETTAEGIGYGLGVCVMLDPAKARIVGSAGEFAWGGVASTAFWVDPVEDLTVVQATQLMPSSRYAIRRELRVLTYQSLTD